MVRLIIKTRKEFTASCFLTLSQNTVKIAQHRSLRERCEAAENLKNSSRCTVPVLVDTMEDEATKAYGGFPERLVVIQHGRIVYLGGNGPYEYDLTELQSWLDGYKAEQLKDCCTT